MRGDAFSAAVLLVLAAAGTAEARPGIVGFSGRPFNGSSDTCTACHTGSTDPPRLDITTPQTIEAGTTGQVTVVVAGSRVRTSMNASFPDGVHAIAGTDTSVPIPLDAPNEVAAVTPPPEGATGTYTFAFVAPAVNGPLTLWVAAVSANGNGAPTGDGVAATTRTILVTGGTDAPAPPSPADAAPATTAIHAVDPFGSSPPSPPASASVATKLPPPPAASSIPEAEAGGCAASPGPPPPRRGPTTLVVSVALLALAITARRRACPA